MAYLNQMKIHNKFNQISAKTWSQILRIRRKFTHRLNRCQWDCTHRCIPTIVSIGMGCRTGRPSSPASSCSILLSWWRCYVVAHMRVACEHPTMTCAVTVWDASNKWTLPYRADIYDDSPPTPYAHVTGSSARSISRTVKVGSMIVESVGAHKSVGYPALDGPSRCVAVSSYPCLLPTAG